MFNNLELYLQEYFSRDSFRAGQREVIEAILQGRDVFALWPTGAGKSLTYQLPALMLPHLTIIVSPLIALMEDQVNQLHSRGIHSAACLSSFQSAQNRQRIMEEIKNGIVKMLFLAPERLTGSFFLQELRGTPVSLLAIDEAHCITQWGHDFRPHYLYLSKVINALKPRSILAVTATASEETSRQIISCLGMNSPFISKLPLDRKNLSYQTLKIPILERSELALAHLKKEGGTPAVVYVSRRRQAEELAEFFSLNGISALPYHAGLELEVRRNNQIKFLNGDTDVITATVAFGMGVDKPNTRQVIHMSPPPSPEGYYQESGRAGRDGNPASCLLMWDYEDFHLLDMQIEDKYPSAEDIDEFYSALEYCAPQSLRPQFAHISSDSWNMLLHAAFGFNADTRRRCMPQVDQESLANYFAVLKKHDIKRLEFIKSYCQAQSCRRRILLNSFDQPAESECTGCDVCRHKMRMKNGSASVKFMQNIGQKLADMCGSRRYA